MTWKNVYHLTLNSLKYPGTFRFFKCLKRFIVCLNQMHILQFVVSFMSLLFRFLGSYCLFFFSSCNLFIGKNGVMSCKVFRSLDFASEQCHLAHSSVFCIFYKLVVGSRAFNTYYLKRINFQICKLLFS